MALRVYYIKFKKVWMGFVLHTNFSFGRRKRPFVLPPPHTEVRIGVREEKKYKPARAVSLPSSIRIELDHSTDCILHRRCCCYARRRRKGRRSQGVTICVILGVQFRDHNIPSHHFAVSQKNQPISSRMLWSQKLDPKIT